jgi:hypothetical protein
LVYAKLSLLYRDTSIKRLARALLISRERIDMSVDSSGKQAVDFVWGNIPMQPNDDRAATISNIGGSTGDYGWAATTQVASVRLDPALDNHANVEAGWSGYPSFVEAAGNYIVTAASGNGTTVTYQSQNFLAPGTTVNITGLTASAYNLSGVTVATSKFGNFTVTNSANAGEITGQRGKVESTTALSAADGVGLGNIIVPSVVGATTAVALDLLKDAGYETANITTATAATNTAKTATAISRTAGSTTISVTASSHGFVAGQKVTISNSGSASANGTYTVLTAASGSFTASGTATTVLALTEITASVVGVAGTISTQSTAANAANISTSATITITPWAAAS